MTYIITTIVISLLGVLTFLPSLRPWAKRNELGVNFITTMLATLVGVLLAIAITNFEEDNKERRDVIKLIGAAKTSLNQTTEYGELLVNFAENIRQNSENAEEAEQTIAEFYEKNPLPLPDYVEHFVTQTLVSKILSQPTLEMLNAQIINLLRSAKARPVMAVFIQKQMITVLELELRLLKGELTLVELSQEHGKLQVSFSKAVEEHGLSFFGQND